MTGTYLERLAARSAAVGTVLCLGLDPDPATLPDGFSRDLAGVERFATLVVEAAAPYAAAIKPNLAFFEAFGSAGLAALERIRGRLPADLPVVVDAKRGDIGTTAARQAVALFDRLGADAVTVNPYLGRRGDRAAARAGRPLRLRPVPDLQPRAPASSRTSSSRRTRTTGAPGRAAPPAGRPARRDLGTGRDRRASSSAATAPAELARASGRSRPGLAFLVPGVGAQGGEIEPVLAARPGDGDRPAGGRPGGGLLVNVSRGIATPRSATAGDGGPARPRGAPRGSRRRLGSQTPCATLARAPDGPRASSRRDAAQRRHDLHRSNDDHAYTSEPLELVIILVIALLILGPGKLPEVGAALGKSIREFRKASTDVQDGGRAQRRHLAAAAPRPAPARRRRRPPRSPPRRAGRRGRRLPPSLPPRRLAAAPAAREPPAADQPRR